jgi:hypothetical protein
MIAMGKTKGGKLTPLSLAEQSVKWIENNRPKGKELPQPKSKYRDK